MRWTGFVGAALLCCALTPASADANLKRAKALFTRSGMDARRALDLDRVVHVERMRAETAARGFVRGPLAELPDKAKKTIDEGKAELIARERDMFAKGYVEKLTPAQLKVAWDFYNSKLGKAYVAGQRKANELLAERGAKLPKAKAKDLVAIKNLILLERSDRSTVNQRAKAYAALFTDDQVRQLSRFVGTEDGRAFLDAHQALSTELRDAIGEIRGPWVTRILRPLLAEHSGQ